MKRLVYTIVVCGTLIFSACGAKNSDSEKIDKLVRLHDKAILEIESPAAAELKLRRAINDDLDFILSYVENNEVSYEEFVSLMGDVVLLRDTKDYDGRIVNLLSEYAEHEDTSGAACMLLADMGEKGLEELLELYRNNYHNNTNTQKMLEFNFFIIMIDDNYIHLKRQLEKNEQFLYMLLMQLTRNNERTDRIIRVLSEMDNPQIYEAIKRVMKTDSDMFINNLIKLCNERKNDETAQNIMELIKNQDLPEKAVDPSGDL